MDRILFTAPSSNSGKTMITCAIIKAMMIKGLKVAAFKCGPDYIDPMFHRNVMGAKTGNLDTFLCTEEQVNYILKKESENTEVSIMEGVMGYYDGMGGTSEKASTYDVARATQTPAVMIIDCRGAGLSVVAVIKGLLEYKKDSNIQGVILNRTTGAMHALLKEIIEKELNLQVYGFLPTIKDFTLKSRHLGLVMPNEIEGLQQQMYRLAVKAIETIDIEGLMELAKTAPPLRCSSIEIPRLKQKIRIGVAMDSAFCFYYRENLALLEEMGAQLIEFSPLEDEKLPENIHGLLLGGGYPEIFAKELSLNTTMKASIFQALSNGLPCVAECGGYLYLLEFIESVKGLSYPMVGFIEGQGIQSGKLVRYGYVNITTKVDTVFGQAGVSFGGHEFHYWDSSNMGDACHVTRPVGGKEQEVCAVKENTFAGFPHLHFYSDINGAFEFLKCCEARNKEGS